MKKNLHQELILSKRNMVICFMKGKVCRKNGKKTAAAYSRIQQGIIKENVILIIKVKIVLEKEERKNVRHSCLEFKRNCYIVYVRKYGTEIYNQMIGPNQSLCHCQSKKKT